MSEWGVSPVQQPTPFSSSTYTWRLRVSKWGPRSFPAFHCCFFFIKTSPSLLVSADETTHFPLFSYDFFSGHFVFPRLLPNMALSSCFLRSQLCFSLGIDRCTRLPPCKSHSNQMSQRCNLGGESTKTGLFGQPVAGKDIHQCLSWNGRRPTSRKSSVVSASWFASSQIAASAFTWGTVAVLPCYTFMVVAPQAEFTKKLVGSSIPYIVLGILYGYLLYLSWTPDTIRLMFASKYWLPELPGIAKMFSSEMTLASAWIHLLAVDLFAARQVYFDGLQENVETRHSISLCLLFCPIGILTHFFTKAVATSSEKTEHGIR